MKKGILLILSGASSVGKGAIRDLLMADDDFHFFYSISMTTRPKRENEVDGKDYYFVDYEAFAQAVRNKDLLEFAEFDGYYYGTPRRQVDFLLNSGKNVLIEVEAQGVGQIKLKHPDAISVFVMPESIEELEKQIHLRYNDEANAQRRISKAKMEMELAPLFVHQVKNTDPKQAAEQIKDFVQNTMEKE